MLSFISNLSHRARTLFPTPTPTPCLTPTPTPTATTFNTPMSNCPFASAHMLLGKNGSPSISSIALLLLCWHYNVSPKPADFCVWRWQVLGQRYLLLYPRPAKCLPSIYNKYSKNSCWKNKWRNMKSFVRLTNLESMQSTILSFHKNNPRALGSLLKVTSSQQCLALLPCMFGDNYSIL